MRVPRGVPDRRAEDTVDPIEVFTTRPDTLFGATFMVLAPEHPLVDSSSRRGEWPGHEPGVDRW